MLFNYYKVRLFYMDNYLNMSDIPAGSTRRFVQNDNLSKGGPAPSSCEFFP